MTHLFNVRKIILGLGVGSLMLLSAGCPAKGPAGPATSYGGLKPNGKIGSSSQFTNPAGMAVLNGKIWILDQGNGSLQQWTTGGSRLQDITSFNTSDSFTSPWGINVDPATNNIYVTDENQRVVVFDSTGAYLTQITVGAGDIRGVAFNSAGTTVYVTDFSTGGYIYSKGGTPTLPTLTPTGTFGTSGTGTLTHAYQVTLDASDNVWVADYSGGQVVKYDPAGTYLSKITSPLVVPTCVTFRSNGDILVPDESAEKVWVFDSTGAQISSFGIGKLGYPEDVERIGNQYYVSDWSSSHIQIFY